MRQLINFIHLFVAPYISFLCSHPFLMPCNPPTITIGATLSKYVCNCDIFCTLDAGSMSLNENVFESEKKAISLLRLCAHGRRFRAFYRFDALFTRTKGKYFQCIELAPTSALNC